MSEQNGGLTSEQGEDDDLLTVRQVAELLSKHRNTIRDWIYKGNLPAQKVGKRGHYMIKRSDLKAALTYKPTSPSSKAE